MRLVGVDFPVNADINIFNHLVTGFKNSENPLLVGILDFFDMIQFLTQHNREKVNDAQPPRG